MRVMVIEQMKYTSFTRTNIDCTFLFVFHSVRVLSDNEGLGGGGICNSGS
jgi:hypothetical protein